jgi:hypothetical protein
MIVQEPTTGAQMLVETAAQSAAKRHWAANLRALQASQPDLAEVLAALPEPAVEWLYGRDGYPTARSFDGWWSGSSLPLRTAQAVLKKMELGAAVTCFLAPTHAAQLRVTLDCGGRARALLAALPDLADLRLTLAADAFDAEIAAGRLAFACGPDWPAALARLLAERDGLPAPGQFVRTPLIDPDLAQSMIASAQSVLAREVARRAESTRAIFTAGRTVEAATVCAITPSTFRLWDDAGAVLAGLAATAGWATLDPDDVRHASPLAFARAAAGRGAVVLANLGRADLCEALPRETRLVTWLTVPRVPRHDPRAPGDALIVADDRWRPLATAAGWPADRVAVGSWPARTIDAPANPRATGLAVIADTLPLATPDFDLSSHRILWDTIARELTDDPFAIGQDVAQYLARWLRRAGIAEETLDPRAFVDRLIVPAHQQGLVRLLQRAGVPVHLHGRGWAEIDEFRAAALGDITSPADLRRALASCAAVAHVWPINWAHPIDTAGRPVLRRTFRGTDAWLAEAHRLAAADPAPAPPPPASSALVADTVIGLLRR